jgi:hypothetical protein
VGEGLSVPAETDERSLVLDVEDVQEEFFARGWTDGLPVVPPTPERVAAMLEVVQAADPDVLIGFVPARNAGVSIEKAAANAVMAGCRPEYFPVVVAALEAMLDPEFNLHTVLTSTGGAAICTIVSGPLAAEIGMNSRHNVLGQGNRANATIGRALRLIAMNVLGAKPGGSDAASLGHPGKYTFCLAEASPPAPWFPLNVRLGYDAGDTTVTLLGVEGPHQFAQQLTGSTELVLRSFARSIRHPAWFATGKGGRGVLVLGPEHAGFCIADGWAQAQVAEFVWREARISPEELLAAGIQLEQGSAHDMTPGDDGKLPSIATPDDVLVLTAGGEGGGFSAWIPGWATNSSSRRVSRRVRPAGEALPDCGPDGCIVPWAVQ